MKFELTEQQLRLVHAREGQPIEVVDPQTTQSYFLIGGEQFEKVRALVMQPGAESAISVPEGIRLSQESLRRDLPELLVHPGIFHHWVAYHGKNRIGIAPNEAALIQECVRQGLRDDEYYIGWIDHSELVNEEEVEVRRQHIVHYGDDAEVR